MRLAPKAFPSQNYAVNFLAHLVLAPDSSCAIVGCLTPDLTRGPLPDNLHPEVLLAAREHQYIDRCTDQHRAFVQSKQRLTHDFGRLAGILVDVFYDHILATQWDQYGCDIPLDAYLVKIHATLDANHDLMPLVMRPIATRLTDQRWMMSYDSIPGIEQTLKRMSARFSERLKRPIDLVPAAKALASDLPHFSHDFSELWPDLVDAVHAWRQSQTSDSPTSDLRK